MIAIYTTAEEEVYVSVFGILAAQQGKSSTTLRLTDGSTLETKKTAHEIATEVTDLMMRIRVAP